MRIIIGGMHHETNTFASSPADYQAFVDGGGWPGILSGEDILDAVKGCNIPIAGFAEAMKRHTLIPTCWASASPSAPVTRHAFETITGEILAGIQRNLPVDGVYLCLHGAMACEHLDDGEGELLGRVRELVGDHVPVVASLDLHANLSLAMMSHSNALHAYRTYPHVDMAETGARAAVDLERRLRGAGADHKARHLPDFLIPLPWQCTMMEPAHNLYQRLAKLESQHQCQLSFCMGFPAADVHDCGPCVIGYGEDPEALHLATRELARAIAHAEAAFVGAVSGPEDAVAEAIRIAQDARRPVVIADAQDNPGAGGDSNTTGVLEALLRAEAPPTALGLLVDPRAAAISHEVGVGASVHLALGGAPGYCEPVHARYEVERLSDGQVACTGPVFRGVRMELGPSACLRVSATEIRILVTSKKAQLADRMQYRFLGITPEEQAILVNKSSVHFRADFEPIAEAIVIAAAPGPMLCDPQQFPLAQDPPRYPLAPPRANARGHAEGTTAHRLSCELPGRPCRDSAAEIRLAFPSRFEDRRQSRIDPPQHASTCLREPSVCPPCGLCPIGTERRLQLVHESLRLDHEYSAHGCELAHDSREIFHIRTTKGPGNGPAPPPADSARHGGQANRR